MQQLSMKRQPRPPTGAIAAPHLHLGPCCRDLSSALVDALLQRFVVRLQLAGLSIQCCGLRRCPLAVPNLSAQLREHTRALCLQASHPHPELLLGVGVLT